jgi:thermostable 8-oxoguanine DNA glycosylase
MADPFQHYKRYQDTYDTISRELDTLRETFLSADRFTQKVMLFDSSVFAVTSVQNDISILRQAFRGYCNSDTWADVQEVLQSVNYGNNKFDYIRSNFDAIFGPTGDKIIDELENRNPIDATDIAVEQLNGVSYIKAPFIFAMLGFKRVMCIDTNVAQMIPDDSVKAKGYNSDEEYWAAVYKVEQEFDDLATEVSTFMLQWVVFDANRGDGVAKHEEWFEHMLPGTTFGRQMGLDAY